MMIIGKELTYCFEEKYHRIVINKIYIIYRYIYIIYKVCVYIYIYKVCVYIYI